ncbi:hypothetical protein DL89DRAFT_269879, partial [Linderina pennispora]
MKMIIEAKDRLADSGSWVVALNMCFAITIYLRYFSGEYTFHRPIRLLEDINYIPQRVNIGFNNINPQHIKEDGLKNKRLLRCLPGILAFKAEY